MKCILKAAMFLVLSVQSFWTEGALAPVFELDLSDGMFPEDTYFSNLNGVLPERSAYKNGYTENGWIVDRLDNRGYVALSPTYNGEGESCRNILELPPAEIEPGFILSWEAKSVYRHFPEQYSVKVYLGEGSGPSPVLLDVDKEDYFWTHREISLDEYAGRRVKIVFECTSDSGYLLALDKIMILRKGGMEEPAVVDDPSAGIVRRMMVDKATGMWCNNCPVADIRLDALRQQLGDRLVVLATHQGDPLQNLPYWDELKWYSLPRMMLNRIQATAGENIIKFQEYLDAPALFGITMDIPEITAERRLETAVHVRVAEPVDNASDRYRVGYVLTGNFHDPDNPIYRQKNNCVLPAYGAYYYLPSEIKAPLVYFDHVTLTSETAFTGIEGSLPVDLDPAGSYDADLSVDIPELLESSSDASLVAFVIDTATGEIMNVVEASPSSLSAVGSVGGAEVSDPALSVDCYGNVLTRLLRGESFRLDVFAPDGRILFSESGISSGDDTFRIPSFDGIVIIRLSSPSGIGIARLKIR